MNGRIVILTGAGISAESGLGTFRDVDGLWTKYDLNDVATPEGFARNPNLVMDFYNARRANAAEAEPNAAHEALARLEADYTGEILIVTQNVDSLHEAAGSKNVLHMHGALNSALCNACHHRWPAPALMASDDLCPRCNAAATRPDVVWFGEIPYGMDVIGEALSKADLFVSIGTSGEVYPAANFVAEADRYGAHTIELNLEPSARASRFAETRFGPATQTVPEWVNDELARTKQ
ncbi:NAD-dependent deacetylase [Shimia isoporae]|uniref:NAD-dependent protein deacylase n=1 Tax=Shimia isoporae TaxID=647720 RepID=A0A4V6NFJ3_9RHOB|nr:NAD-dependent deacylase [Shimia isoporae]TCK99320.1 NAD-dependent deacetylase [Shimia isoporae]